MSSESGNHVYALIMAGGSGRILWPVSRKKKPKQFVELFDEGCMIARTLKRITACVREENIFIITSERGRTLLADSLPEFRPQNIIAEPSSRNTAPCIALATAHIRKRDPDAVTVVLPADHLVLDEPAFIKLVRAGIEFARSNEGLVTIGVTADRPETSYGYIQADEELPLPASTASLDGCRFFKVKAFAEKPDYATALQFVESHDFFWNSGVFIWHIDAISREFERSMPDLYKDLISIYESLGTKDEEKVIKDVYSWIHPISIDYGIMEKASSVHMLTGEFGWTDLGCWDEVLKVAESRAAVNGEQHDSRLVQLDCENLYIRKPAGKVICTIGVSDLIIVETDDALLICNRGSSHRVGEVADILRREDLEEYL